MLFSALLQGALFSGHSMNPEWLPFLLEERGFCTFAQGLFPFLSLFFNYGLHSTLVCISFRCTAWWLDNHTRYEVIPPIFTVPAWHRAKSSHCYWLYSLCCALGPRDYSVAINWYFSIPLPLSLSPPTFLPSAHVFFFFWFFKGWGKNYLPAFTLQPFLALYIKFWGRQFSRKMASPYPILPKELCRGLRLTCGPGFPCWPGGPGSPWGPCQGKRCRILNTPISHNGVFLLSWKTVPTLIFPVENLESLAKY